MTAPSRPRPPRVVAAAPHREKRSRAARAERRRRRARRLLRALLVLLPGLALAWLVLASPVLAVRDVQVTGTARLPAAQVSAAAAVADGTPLARIDVAEVADRVERALPPVAQVQVRRAWPSTLRLQVVERTAVAAVVRAGGVLLVDAEGVGFATEPALPPGVPALAVSRPDPGDPATRAALAVLATVPEGVRGQLARIEATGPADVTLVLGDGRTVVWGSPADAATKARALQTLLAMPGTRYDVSAPGIVVRR